MKTQLTLKKLHCYLNQLCCLTLSSACDRTTVLQNKHYVLKHCICQVLTRLSLSGVIFSLSNHRSVQDGISSLGKVHMHNHRKCQWNCLTDHLRSKIRLVSRNLYNQEAFTVCQSHNNNNKCISNVLNPSLIPV